MRILPGILLISALSACGSPTGSASGAASAGITVDAPWIRAASLAAGSAVADVSAGASAMSGHDMGGAEDAMDSGAVSAGYMTLHNTGSQDDRLLEASSDAAGVVQMHVAEMKDNVMSMRQVQSIDVPPGQTVALAPGGLHLMLLDLKHDLTVGENVKLTLRFERAGTVELDVPVRESAPGED